MSAERKIIKNPVSREENNLHRENAADTMMEIENELRRSLSIASSDDENNPVAADWLGGSVAIPVHHFTSVFGSRIREPEVETGWAGLKPEILWKIFDFLNYCDLHFCSMVSPNWAKVAAKYWYKQKTVCLLKMCHDIPLPIDEAEEQTELGSGEPGFAKDESASGDPERCGAGDGAARQPPVAKKSLIYGSGLHVFCYTTFLRRALCFRHIPEVLDLRVKYFCAEQGLRILGGFTDQLAFLLHQLQEQNVLQYLKIIRMNVDSNIFNANVLHFLVTTAPGARFRLVGRGPMGLEATADAENFDENQRNKNRLIRYFLNNRVEEYTVRVERKE